jgi:pimeloyl-ACP methyl ester carboxylesterase
VNTALFAWRWWLEAGSREDLSRRASSIEAPVLVLAGSRDPVLGLAVQNEIVRLLHAERLVLSSAAGHLIPLEDPSSCVRLLRTAARQGVPHGPELVRRAA